MRGFHFCISIAFLLLIACTQSKPQADPASCLPVKSYLEIRYYKDTLLTMETPQSEGKQVPVTWPLYSLHNAGADCVYVMTETWPDVKSIIPYPQLYMDNPTWHTKRDWHMGAEHGWGSLMDSAFLLPGKAFVFFSGEMSGSDIDSLSFQLKVKVRLGARCKDTLIHKMMCRQQDGKFAEAQK